MDKAPDHHITPQHYAAFGAIINTFVEIETLLDAIIIAMIGGREEITAILLTLLGTKDKRDFIVAISKESNLPPVAVSGLEGLMKRVKSVANLRNSVAHRSWVAGRKEGTIKPMYASARETLKVLGLEWNEKEWTADQLHQEVLNNQELGRDFIAFMERYGLTPSIARKTTGSKSESSES